MAAARGRSIAVLSALGGLPVLAAGAYLGKELAIERWHIQKLSSANVEDRCAAIRKLGEMRMARAVPCLFEIWMPGISPFNTHDGPAMLARDALVRIGDRGVPWLISALNDKRRLDGQGLFVIPRREAALAVLAEIGPPAGGAVPALLDALRDEDHALRIGACEALGSIGGGAAPALEALRLAMGDPEGQVQYAARKAMEKIGAGETP